MRAGLHLLKSRSRAGIYPAIKTTGTPQNFLELPEGYFIYILIASGKIIFISAGLDPWAVALKLKRKYKADRILYQASTVDDSPSILETLIEKYKPRYNSTSNSAQLSELDAILGNSNACAA